MPTEKEWQVDVARVFGEILDQLDAAGFTLPFRFAAISRNGSVLAGRYVPDETDGVQCEVLAEHFEGGGFHTPIHVMFIDAREEAAHFLLTAEGLKRVLH